MDRSLSEQQSGPAQTVERRLARCLAEIRSCEQRYDRVAGSVSLLAVSKRQSVAAIAAACAAGQRAFGENYLDEALEKQAALAELDLEWHFIGAIQSNKTRAIASAFTWVHTLDRLKIAERLSAQRPPQLGTLKVFVQVNISGEPTKHGVSPDQALDLAAAVTELPRLSLQGFMALPAPSSELQAQRQAFAELKALAEQLPEGATKLSIGTSNDYVAAIAEGASMVRLGTALFGPRPASA